MTTFPADSYADLTVAWWRWINSIPKSRSPAYDDNGKNSKEGQRGPVWFLAGATKPGVERSCEIPAGRYVVFPIINGETAFVDDPKKYKTLEDLTEAAKSDMDNVKQVNIRFDKGTLKDLKISRVLSHPYDVTYIPEGIYESELAKKGKAEQIKTDSPIQTMAVSDGYWAFAGPLDAGTYSFKFRGELDGFVCEVTYHLVVK